MGGADLYGRRITAGGAPLPERAIDNSSGDQYGAAVAAYPPNAAAPYLVVYEDASTNLQGDVRGRLLDGDGQPVEVLDVATVGDRPEGEPAVSGSESLGGYLVLWTELEEENAIWGRYVKGTGEMRARFPVSPFEGAPSGATQQAPLSTCPSFDRDGDTSVDIAELIRAVNDALLGCG